MNEKIETKPIALKPFKRFCMTIGELPSSYLETMSYYEMLLWFTKYLGETVIPAINNNAEAVTEVQNLFLELQDYVNNYFDDLNIQNEINNKLDDMAESGELVEIIGQYLETSAILGFDTKADLKGADNLIDGSITETLGDLTYGDGKGQLYKIRSKTELDVVDDNNILALTNFNDLIAEKIPNYRMNQVESEINVLNRMINRKYILVGDSYAEGWTPDGSVTGWAELLKGLLGLDSTNCTITFQGGCGFTPLNNTYTNLINALTSDNEVTDIIVCGGYNDRNASIESIQSGALAFKNACVSKFPNANIYLGFVGFTNTNERNSFYKARNFYSIVAGTYGFNYLNNVEYCLRNTYDVFASDNYHPNATGQNQIARAVYESYKTGSATVSFNFTNLSLTVSSTFDTLEGGFTQNIGTVMSNNVVNISMQSYGSIKSTDGVSITCNGNQLYEVGTITEGYITGTGYYTANVPIDCVVQDTSSGSSKYYAMSGTLKIEGKKLYVSLIDTNDSLNNYRTLTEVKQIQVFPFSAQFDSMFC